MELVLTFLSPSSLILLGIIIGITFSLITFICIDR